MYSVCSHEGGSAALRFSCRGLLVGLATGGPPLWGDLLLNRAMKGRLKHEQGELFYLFTLGEAVPSRRRSIDLDPF